MSELPETEWYNAAVFLEDEELTDVNAMRDELLARIAELEAEAAECGFQASTKSDKDRILQLDAENERLRGFLAAYCLLSTYNAERSAP